MKNKRKLTDKELDGIREAEKMYQKRVQEGQWVESNCSRGQLLNHIDILEAELQAIYDSQEGEGL